MGARNDLVLKANGGKSEQGMMSQSRTISAEAQPDLGSHSGVGTKPQNSTHLHIGCGKCKSEGSIGVDISPMSSADVLADLDHTPWPFVNESFDEVIAIDILEHLKQFLPVMSEIHRVLAPGGLLRVRVPGASSHHQVTDPTHSRAFTSKSFQYFTDAFQSTAFSYSNTCFTVVNCQYRFTYNRSWLDRILLKWVNNHKIRYERRFLYWYQIPELHFVLRKGAGNLASCPLR